MLRYRKYLFFLLLCCIPTGCNTAHIDACDVHTAMVEERWDILDNDILLAGDTAHCFWTHLRQLPLVSQSRWLDRLQYRLIILNSEAASYFEDVIGIYKRQVSGHPYGTEGHRATLVGAEALPIMYLQIVQILMTNFDAIPKDWQLDCDVEELLNIMWNAGFRSYGVQWSIIYLFRRGVDLSESRKEVVLRAAEEDWRIQAALSDYGIQLGNSK